MQHIVKKNNILQNSAIITADYDNCCKSVNIYRLNYYN